MCWGNTQVINKFMGQILCLLLTWLLINCTGCQGDQAQKPPAPLRQQEPLVIQDGYQIFAQSRGVSIRKDNLLDKTINLGESNLEVAYRLYSKPSGQTPLMDYQIDSGVVLSGQEHHYVLQLQPQVQLLLQYPRPHHRQGSSIHIEKEANRLHLYSDGWLVKSYEVSTGIMPWYTPEGSFQIANKMPYPQGRDSEATTGTRWMGLAVPSAQEESGNQGNGANPLSPPGLKFGIHGTSDESSIGIHASAGSIRMHNENVNELYNLVDMGTPVQIVP